VTTGLTSQMPHHGPLACIWWGPSTDFNSNPCLKSRSKCVFPTLDASLERKNYRYSWHRPAASKLLGTSKTQLELPFQTKTRHQKAQLMLQIWKMPLDRISSIMGAQRYA
jgi:hypothetical protein